MMRDGKEWLHSVGSLFLSRHSVESERPINRKKREGAEKHKADSRL
jgi:hypothetical protein